jgi:PhzF family phenazine biosynthesis protein
MSLLPIYQVDAFTSELFSGNPAAVVILNDWLPDDQLQAIAAENNVSETAFLKANARGYNIRWFTPAVEVPLCGHATLASAHVLYQCLGWSSDEIRFSTQLHGDLVVKEVAEAEYELDFPAAPAMPMAVQPELMEALGQTVKAQYKSGDIWLALMRSEQDVQQLSPDLVKLSQLNCRGVIVTAEGQEVDFVSRYFAPNAGIDEDPVTGSAHCILTPFWSTVLGKSKLTARQLSARTGELVCTLDGSRVRMTGSAVLYLKGEICVPETG